MHGKPFVPSASLILAKAPESRAKRLKTGQHSCAELQENAELSQELSVTGWKTELPASSL